VVSFELEARGPFSLAESARFAGGFSPTAHSIDGEREELDIAFVPDGAERAVHVHVREGGDGVVAECEGEPGAAARDQLARILGLDVDATEFADIGRRDPVVHGLQLRWPGFRPISFPSPFEAGMWFLISQRTQFRHALAIKERLARELGDEVDGLHAFPAPQAIADLAPVPGVSQVKLERGRALARAALDGLLHGERLRSLGPEAAIEELKDITGVGPFTAQGIVVRGANEPDWLPSAEPRLGKAIEQAYGAGAPDTAAWRPYRSWVAVMLRRTLQ
jgi:DNA-3-methyladenine glycosylase II